jgi:hypothetical protein
LIKELHKKFVPKGSNLNHLCTSEAFLTRGGNFQSDPGSNFWPLELVVPKRLTAAGMTRDGERTSAKERLYDSVPNRLCNHPLLPENPSATTQQFLKPRLVSALATILAESEYLNHVRN